VGKLASPLSLQVRTANLLVSVLWQWKTRESSVQIQTPDWVKHYFLSDFPDRFAKSQQACKRFEVCLGKPGTICRRPGLQGDQASEQLDYLQNLGINATSPHLQSASNHRYHTHDYYQVDPMWGNEAFQELLKACHQRNIKVVLDGVFNHSSRGFSFPRCSGKWPHSPGWIG